MSGIEAALLGMTLAQTGVGLAQGAGQAKAQGKQIKREAEIRNKEIKRQREREEKRRKDALKQALATQRARFAGTGRNADSGSGSAVLKRLNRLANEDLLDISQSANSQRELNDLNTRSALSNLRRQSTQRFTQSLFDLGSAGLKFGAKLPKTPATKPSIPQFPDWQ